MTNFAAGQEASDAVRMSHGSDISNVNVSGT